MYPAKNNSPVTTTTAALNSSDTTMVVADASVLPSAPNIAVLGSGENAEIVKYTAINSNTVTIVRGQNGTIPGVWPSGTTVARNFTAMDHEAFRANILDLESRKLDGVAWGSVTGTLNNQTDLKSALDAKAPLESPALTGTPTAPTAEARTNTTQLATTAFATTADNATHDQLLTLTESLRGKKVSIIGDSISTFSGYIPSGYATHYPTGTVQNVEQTWWYQLLSFTGATLEVNASYSGSAASDVRGTGYPTFYDRTGANFLGNPDVIIVALGTNDSTNNAPMGDFDFTTAYSSLSVSNFATAYIKGVKALQANYSGVEIICVCLAISNPKYATAIQYIAENLGVKFVYSNDFIRESGSHPGAVGMKQIAMNVMTNNPGLASNKGLLMGEASVAGDLRIVSDYSTTVEPSATTYIPGITWMSYNGEDLIHIKPHYYASGMRMLEFQLTSNGVTEQFIWGVNQNDKPRVTVTTPSAWLKGIGAGPTEITGLAPTTLASGVTVNERKAYRCGYNVTLYFDITLSATISSYGYLTAKKLPLLYGLTSNVFYSVMPFDVNLSTHNAKPLNLRFYYSSGDTVSLTIKDGAAARYIAMITYVTTVDP